MRSGKRKGKETKDDVRVPQELQAESAAISWDDTAGGASLSGEAAVGGGRVDRRPRVRLGQVKFQLAVRHLREDFIF